MFNKVGIGLATIGAVSLGVYLRFIRPWQLRWGATSEEVAYEVHMPIDKKTDRLSNAILELDPNNLNSQKMLRSLK